MAPSFSTWIETLVSVLMHPEVREETSTLLQNKDISLVQEHRCDADISVPVNLEVGGISTAAYPPMPPMQDQDLLPASPSSTGTTAQKLRLQRDMRQGLSRLFM